MFWSVELADLLSIDKNVAWLDGMAFDQLVVRMQGDHVLAMIKAHRKGKAYIAYVACQTYATTLSTVGEQAAGGHLDWKVDKYPSKRVQAL